MVRVQFKHDPLTLRSIRTTDAIPVAGAPIPLENNNANFIILDDNIYNVKVDFRNNNNRG